MKVRALLSRMGSQIRGELDPARRARDGSWLNDQERSAAAADPRLSIHPLSRSMDGSAWARPFAARRLREPPPRPDRSRGPRREADPTAQPSLGQMSICEEPCGQSLVTGEIDTSVERAILSNEGEQVAAGVAHCHDMGNPDAFRLGLPRSQHAIRSQQGGWR